MRFHMPARERSVCRFPTARCPGGPRPHSRTLTLGARPGRVSLDLWAPARQQRQPGTASAEASTAAPGPSFSPRRAAEAPRALAHPALRLPRSPCPQALRLRQGRDGARREAPGEQRNQNRAGSPVPHGHGSGLGRLGSGQGLMLAATGLTSPTG